MPPYNMLFYNREVRILKCGKKFARVVWGIVIVSMLGPFVLTFIINGIRWFIK